jgi:hypothetical protein
VSKIDQMRRWGSFNLIAIDEHPHLQRLDMDTAIERSTGRFDLGVASNVPEGEEPTSFWDAPGTPDPGNGRGGLLAAPPCSLTQGVRGQRH